LQIRNVRDSEQTQLVDLVEGFRAQAAPSQVHGELFVEAEDRVRHARVDFLGVTTEFLEVGVVREGKYSIDLQAIFEARIHRPTGQCRGFEFTNLVHEAAATR
jgi:hypothetical protein